MKSIAGTIIVVMVGAFLIQWGVIHASAELLQAVFEFSWEPQWFQTLTLAVVWYFTFGGTK